MADATAWISGAIHATASDWAARVVTNGGAAVSDNTLAAVSNFCGALDAAAITVLMSAVNVFAPDNLIASITPLIVGVGVDPWTNTNFVAADLSIQGLKGNGSNKYLDSGVVANAAFSGTTEGGISLYNTFATIPTTQSEMAGGSSATVNILLESCSGANAIFNCFSNGNGQVSGATNLPFGLGFTSGNRTTASAASIYTANSIVAFSALATSALTNIQNPQAFSIAVFAVNYNAVISRYSGKRLSFAAIHHGLTSAQCQALYNAVQQMRQAFGGGWV